MRFLNLIVLFLLLQTYIKSEVILDEKFQTSTMPTGWTTTAIQGSATWTIRNTPGFGSTSGSYYTIFDDEALGGSVSPNQSALTTPTLNCGNHLAVFMRLQHYWYGVEGTFGYIEISNDGGTTWNNILTLEKTTKGSLATPQDTTINITPWAANKNNVQVRFRYSDGNQAGKFWYIDDVLIFSNPDANTATLLAPDFLDCTKSYSNNEQVKVRVYNKGQTPISNIPITLKVSETITLTTTEIIAGPIAAQSYIDYTFTTTVDMSTDGYYSFVIYTTLPGEKYFVNDTLRQGRRSKVTTLPYTENFNINTGGWKPGGTNCWEWGTTTKLGGGYGNAWVTNLSGNYNPSQNSHIQSPPFDLSGLNANPIISYDIKYNTEAGYDHVYLQYSLNNGTNWTTIRNFTGNSSGWKSISDTLKFTSCNSCVLFRFLFTSDGSAQYEGAIIDNFEVKKNPEKYDVSALDIHFDNRCTMTNAMSVGISIRNKSNYPTCNVPIKVIITHPTLPTQTLTGIIQGPLMYNQMTNHYFATKADLSGAGQYSFTGVIEYPLDCNAMNDTTRRTEPVIINTFPYIEDFESTKNNWVASSNINHTWEYGIMTDLGGPQGYGNSWTTNIYGKYNPGEWSSLYSPLLDFSAMDCPYMTFDLKYYTENSYDWLVVQYSTDGGNNWTTLGSSSEPNWYNHAYGWTNFSNNNWINVQHAIMPLANKPCAQIRFLFKSDGGAEFDGIAIDNIRIFNNTQDVGVIAIVTPASICNNTANELVTIAVKNYGCAAVSNVLVKFEYNGPSSGVLSDIVPGPIAPGAEVNFTFASLIDLSNVGLYNFTTYTELSTDMNHTNDTSHKAFMVDVPRIASFPYSEDFNTNNGQWLSGGTNNSWKYGIFTGMSGDGGNGACWSTNVGGTNYNALENSWLISPIFELVNSPDPIVEFDIKYATEGSFDPVTFQVSLNGGQTYKDIKLYSGSSNNNWVHFKDTIFTNSCDLSCLRFRFYFHSDGSVQYEGIAIDNFKITPNANTNKAEIVDLHFNNRCAHTNTESIGISIRNLGFNVICNAPVFCLITHPIEPPQLLVGIVPGPIQRYQRANYIFPNTADLSKYVTGQYTLKGWVSVNGDTDHSNDTIVRYAPDTVKTYPYTANFDTWHQNWVSNGNLQNTWEINTLNRMGGNSGFSKSWITSYYYTYNPSESSWIMSPLLDFSTLSCPAMGFDIKYMTEVNYDWIIVEYSLNDGATWTKLGTASDPIWYNAAQGWTGNSANKWIYVQHELSALAGHSCVLIRLQLYADGGNQQPGIALDNIRIWDNNPDVLPVAIIKPTANVENCNRRLNEDVVIRFQNFGCNKITNIPFTLSYFGPLNGSFTETITDTIPAHSYIDYVCTNTINMSAQGSYTFKIISNLSGDAFKNNDTLVHVLNQIFYQPLVVSSYPYIEDFESNDGSWIVHASSANPSWIWGTATNKGTMTGNCWATNLTGNYNNSEYSYLYTPIFDMSAVVSPFIEFDMKIKAEGGHYDYMWMEYSINGGITWTKLGTGYADSKWYENGSEWLNWGLDWQHKEISACALAKKSCVLFRFIFRSDGSANYEGIAIDNFKISNFKNNVGVIDILSPKSVPDLCLRRENVPITIRVRNFSCDTLSNIPVNFTMYGISSVSLSEIITNKIAPQDYIDYTFTSTLNLVTVGTNNIKAYTSLGSDTYIKNDTAYSSVVVTNYLDIINTFPYSEDFNSGEGGWQTVGNTSFTLGSFSKMGGNSGYGNSWVTNLTGDYNPNENGYIVSPIFDLSNMSCAWIGFDHKYITEGYWDYGQIDYSINGGVSWTRLGIQGDYLNWYVYPHTWIGNGGTKWIHSEHDISFLAGKSCVIFRYYFYSDNAKQYEGMAFDNFNLHSTPIDAALSHVFGCYDANEPIKINIRNNNDGSTRYCNPVAAITSIDVSVSINGSTATTQTISGLNIAPNSTATVEVPGLYAPNNTSSVFVRISNPNNKKDYIIFNDTMTVHTNKWPACNDHCKYAIEIYSGTTMASQTSNATANPSEDPPFTSCQPMTYENTVYYFFRTDSTGQEVTFSITNTICAPSSNGLQVNILKIVNDTCNQSDNIEIACFNTGNINDIVFGPIALEAKSAYLIAIDGYANNNCNFNLNLSGGVILPIQLLDFNAKLKNGVVKLDWSTTSETNNKQFIVQRIAQYGNGFKDIAIVNASGNSNQLKVYSTIDEEPLKGISYYRLKQVDFDGKYSFSNIRSVNNFEGHQIFIHPNPVFSGNNINININRNIEKLKIVFIDAIGKIVKEIEKIGIENNLKFSIPIDFQPGVYKMKLMFENRTEIYQIVVL